MRLYTQKELFDYLSDNPLHIPVHMGAIEDMEGKDYIVLDYLNQIAMTRDNTADYQQVMQITCLTRSYEDRKTLVSYIQDQFLTTITFMLSAESDYYIAQCTIGVFVYE